MTLIDAAKEVRAHAYAPYSGFKVGAALRSDKGQVFVGCNVENVAYPEGLCAEAGAIAAMVAAGHTKIVEFLVVADGAELITPCGGCRQKIAEFAAPELIITLAKMNDEQAQTTLAEILPGSFGAGHLTNGS